MYIKMLPIKTFLDKFFEIYPDDMTDKDFDIPKTSKDRLKKIDHNHFPIVKKDGTPPRIDDMVCMHYNCQKKFYSREAFIEHLKLHDCYRRGYTKSHTELDTKYINLGSSYICNSEMCNFKCKDLHIMILHHILIGSIKNQNVTIDDYVYYHDYIRSGMNLAVRHNIQKSDISDTIENIWKRLETMPEECVSCQTNKPNILLYPCLHVVLCANCIKYIRNSKCPICRVKYVYSYNIL